MTTASAHAGGRAVAHSSSKIVIYVSTAKIKGVGTVLVNGAGRTLYVFAPDDHKKVTCNSACQGYWPAATVPPGSKIKAKGRVEQKLLGYTRNPVTHEGILTYNGWPLYTYIADSAPDMARGQNTDLNGGYWWVILPNGKVLK